MKQTHFIVHGKVQGVWFRAWVRDLARHMGVVGWVRNTSDGNVEGIAMADDDIRAAFGARLHDGPPLARVTKVVSRDSEATEIMDSFKIRV